MIRGTTLFICTKCKKVFLAPDMEYNATFFSLPIPCKHCGSRRTMPMWHRLAKSVYEKIWETMEKK